MPRQRKISPPVEMTNPIASLDGHRCQQRPRRWRKQADVGAGVLPDAREQGIAALNFHLNWGVLPVGAVHGQFECDLAAPCARNGTQTVLSGWTRPSSSA